ncbi:MAG: zinc-binding dehydrogenase, partial [Gemmataceae bacterium]
MEPAALSMRQAVIAAPDRFEVRDAPRPAGPLVLRTAACGICSGDLMPWYLAKKVGTVFGHEPVGRAVHAEGLGHVREGDLVFVHHHAPCLACPDCARGAPVHCATWKRTRLDPGGMAEYIAVSREMATNDCFPVNDLTAEQALFIEPLACCAKAFARAGPAARVAVVGCGVMGLLNVQAARACGAAEVVAVEPDAFRRGKAREAGADAALTPEEAARELRHWADVAVIGPGFPEVIRAALEYVRPAGVACLFTPTASGVLTPLDLGELYFREVSLVPSYSCGPADTRRAYEWIRTRAVRPEAFITHRFALDDIQRAYDAARRG